MDRETEKTIGYVLLAAGLILIVFAIYSMFNVFTGIAEPPSIFKMNNITVSIATGMGMPPEKVELLSGREASKVVNMGLWYIFMLFIVSAGTKIGSLGVQLIREIKREL